MSKTPPPVPQPPTRRTLLAGAAALAGCRESLAQDTSPAELVVVAGQSNALGFLLSGRDLPPGAYRPDPRVRIWTDRGFETMTPGANTGSPNNPQCWGPEVGYAHAWLAAHRIGTLHIVKYARGSTALAEGAGCDWSPESGELFAKTTADVQAARRVMPARAPVSAIVWMQGEQDAASEATARAYGRNLARALPRMRAEWADPATPVLFGRIGLNWPFAALVRAAQAQVDAADPLAASVETSEYPLLPDGLHYAAAGQLRLGADLYAARPS
jgi:hypothetical protein